LVIAKFKVLLCICSEGLRKPIHIKKIIIGGATVTIQTKHLFDISQKHYCLDT
jgi:hypothetical protein